MPFDALPNRWEPDPPSQPDPAPLVLLGLGLMLVAHVGGIVASLVRPEVGRAVVALARRMAG